MGTRDDEYDYLFKGKSPLLIPSLPSSVFLFLSDVCDWCLFVFTYSGDVPRSTDMSLRFPPPRRRRARHAERHLVNDGHLSVEKRARDDIRNDDPPSRGAATVTFSPREGGASCRDSSGRLPGRRLADFGPSPRCPLPAVVPSRLSLSPWTRLSFPAP